MFYSHEILTSRKYGVATVWLVATLGSHSSLKKVNRKAILEVDVPKACETILAPEAPMALRLQSNLLYGVSRVYSQQCTFVLTDAQNAQNTIRALLKAVKTSQLDPDAGKARPDQLVLQDDPAFVLDLALAPLNLEFSSSSSDLSRASSLLSPLSLKSSVSSVQGSEPPLPGLIIPSSDPGGLDDFGGFQGFGDDFSSTQKSGRVGIADAGPMDADDGFNPDIDFSFDAEGNVIELPGPGEAVREQTPSAREGRVRGDSAASGRVRLETEEALRARPEVDYAMDVDYDVPAGDYLDLPEAEPFPEMAAPGAARAGILENPSVVEEEIDESSDSSEAPVRRRHKKIQTFDIEVNTELRNADLARWNNEYARNMSEIMKHKQQYKIAAQAKRNAAFWVFKGGIGGIGSGLGRSSMPSPLQIFSGQSLMATLTGGWTSRARAQGLRPERDLDEGGVIGEEPVQGDDGDHVGRAEEQLDEDYGLILGQDDNIEMGRNVPSEPGDFSSVMPWNVSASVRGSRQGSSIARGRGFSGSVGGFPSSAGGPGSQAGGSEVGPRSSLHRRMSLLTSASPLTGRGRAGRLERLSSLELPEHEELSEPLGDEGLAVGDLEAQNEYEIFGPAANVDTQTAAESQWMKKTLDKESYNFFDFISAGFQNLLEDGNGDELAQDAGAGAAGKDFITFSALLPPREHSKIVAAQAFHHTLALATKNLITLLQEEDYGELQIRLQAGAEI